MVHQSNRFVVRVATSLAVPKMLDYLLISNELPTLGSFVEVEVGTKKVHGVIFEVVNTSQESEIPPKLKEAKILDSVPPVALPMLKFYRWVSRYTMALPGDPIRAALVSGRVPEIVAPEKFIVPTVEVPSKITAARQKVFDIVDSEQFTSQSALAEAAGVGTSVVKGLLDKNNLSWQSMPEETLSFDIKLPELSPSQSTSAARLASSVSLGEHKTFFLDGVMGSGKTEVYFDTIARILEADNTGQVLLLVPEISLTPQLVSRFEK
ncbi:MAG: primosomal protein N' (replication factor Y), partial [bacterium]